MVTGLKSAIVSAIFLLPFAYPHSALSQNWSLTYQAAVWMCGTGNLQACDVMYRYEMARSAVPARIHGESRRDLASGLGGVRPLDQIFDFASAPASGTG